MAKHFLVKPTTTKEMALLYSITDAGGRPLSVITKCKDEPNPKLIAALVPPYPPVFSDLISSMTDQFLVSEKAAGILETLEYPPNTKFLPIAIGGRHRQLGGCVCIYFDDFLKAVDMQASEVKYRGGVAIRAVRPVLKSSCLAGYDLADVLYTGYVCSERFRVAVEKAGLQNFSFELVQEVS